MFEIEIGGKTYEFSCKLGVTKKIKNKFQKSFNAILGEIGDYDIPDLIKFLYTAIITDIEYKDFEELVYENVGAMELNDHVMLMIKKLQYPNLTLEEINKKIAEQKN